MEGVRRYNLHICSAGNFRHCDGYYLHKQKSAANQNNMVGKKSGQTLIAMILQHKKDKSRAIIFGTEDWGILKILIVFL